MYTKPASKGTSDKTAEEVGLRGGGAGALMPTISVHTDLGNSTYTIPSAHTTGREIKRLVLGSSFHKVEHDMFLKGPNAASLRDHDTLAECGISTDAVLSLQLRLRAGVGGELPGRFTDDDAATGASASGHFVFPVPSR